MEDSAYMNNTTNDDIRTLCHAISIDNELEFLKIIKRFRAKFRLNPNKKKVKDMV